MKQASTVASAWRRSHAGTPPVGFTMREDHPDAWVRLHTLPHGKRIPSSESERHTVLDRWNQVARLVFEAPGTVRVFVLEAGPTGASGHCRTLMEQTGLRQVSRRPAEWLRRLDVYMDMSEAAFWAGTLGWAAGCLDTLILAAAMDDVGPVTVFSMERGDALCPYDGGVDSFLREPLRTSVATVFREWVA